MMGSLKSMAVLLHFFSSPIMCLRPDDDLSSRMRVIREEAKRQAQYHAGTVGRTESDLLEHQKEVQRKREEEAEKAQAAADAQEELNQRIAKRRVDSDVIATSSAEKVYAKPEETEYDLAKLQKKTGDGLPVDVDPAIKEQYLNDHNFKTVFKMTKEEFSKTPTWKQQKLKKSANLF